MQCYQIDSHLPSVRHPHHPDPSEFGVHVKFHICLEDTSQDALEILFSILLLMTIGIPTFIQVMDTKLKSIRVQTKASHIVSDHNIRQNNRLPSFEGIVCGPCEGYTFSHQPITHNYLYSNNFGIVTKRVAVKPLLLIIVIHI